MVRKQPGPSVKQPLVKSNPRPRESCGRALCPYTRAGEECRERCYRENVGYMGRCLRCAAKQREEGKEEKEIVWTTYHRETSRSVVSLAREHFEQYRAAMIRRFLHQDRNFLPREDWERQGQEEGDSGRERRRAVAGWRTTQGPIMMVRCHPTKWMTTTL